MQLQITDQTAQPIYSSEPPRRIISCVPSQTELLFDLGLEDAIVGITKFCVHPAMAKLTKTIVGGTKNLHLEKIAALEPDFILANKEENDRDSIEWLASRFPTYVSDVKTLDDALNMILDVGKITNTCERAIELSDAIMARFRGIAKPPVRFTAAYIIWQDPWMTVNHDTFIHDILNRLGFNNVFAQRSESRYPIITATDLEEANPDYVFLSSEPYPFAERHVGEIQMQFPRACIILVDGEMFSWYGSRLLLFNTSFAQNIPRIA
jgi:ABC-type Fe3+-hydroxamate transport system substrate-binding protein